ncbi:secreted RxLR effector protein 161-like [Cucumis melo]|uniref:Secreted RxLR effector protein 161-like n=1 Tax=Cucumis melo TaxID=3656 RepID=A0ABM3KBK3_CUCME|nr:secreted RxLR effector protein 161-like [Cucumis melo]
MTFVRSLLAVAVISDLQHYLDQCFEIKDLGSLNYFLGLEVSWCLGRYLMSQAKYAFDFLLRSGIIDSNTTSMPLDPNVHLTPYDGVPLEDFMTAPRTIHFTFVLHILRYIKGTLGHGLQFSSQSSLVLSGYFDVDWPGDPIDRGTTIGYCFYLGDSLISWHSKKKSVVSCSSTEPKYNALVDTTVELLWLCWLIANMGAPQ